MTKECPSMHDDILDSPEDFDRPFEAGTEVLAIKWFFLEAEARVYAARLRESGIPSFVSNANATTMIPFGGGGIGLHIKKTDEIEARALIKKMDAYNQQLRVEESYHDYDKEDIAYLQEVENQQNQGIDLKSVLIIFIILISLIYAILHNYRYF